MASLNDPMSMSHLSELCEVILFNTEKFCKMNYDAFTHKDYRQGLAVIDIVGSFKLSDQRVQELLGSKRDYYQALARAFFLNPEDPQIWENDETLKVALSWLKSANRGTCKNVWDVIKQLLKKLSQHPNITNAARHKYDRITLGQLLLFTLLMRIRTRVVLLLLADAS